MADDLKFSEAPPLLVTDLDGSEQMGVAKASTDRSISVEELGKTTALDGVLTVGNGGRFATINDAIDFVNANNIITDVTNPLAAGFQVTLNSQGVGCTFSAPMEDANGTRYQSNEVHMFQYQRPDASWSGMITINETVSSTESNFLVSIPTGLSDTNPTAFKFWAVSEWTILLSPGTHYIADVITPDIGDITFMGAGASQTFIVASTETSQLQLGPQGTVAFSNLSIIHNTTNPLIVNAPIITNDIYASEGLRVYFNCVNINVSSVASQVIDLEAARIQITNNNFTGSVTSSVDFYCSMFDVSDTVCDIPVNIAFNAKMGGLNNEDSIFNSSTFNELTFTKYNLRENPFISGGTSNIQYMNNCVAEKLTVYGGITFVLNSGAFNYIEAYDEAGISVVGTYARGDTTDVNLTPGSLPDFTTGATTTGNLGVITPNVPMSGSTVEVYPDGTPQVPVGTWNLTRYFPDQTGTALTFDMDKLVVGMTFTFFFTGAFSGTGAQLIASDSDLITATGAVQGTRILLTQGSGATPADRAAAFTTTEGDYVTFLVGQLAAQDTSTRYLIEIQRIVGMGVAP